MADSIDVLLARAVPKAAAAGDEKLRGLKAKLGRFAARVWVKGKGKLEQLGISVRSSVHAAALEAAEASQDDDDGAFLEDVRKAMKDDAAFGQFLAALVRAYSAFMKKKKESAAAADATGDEDEEKPAKKRAPSGRTRAAKVPVEDKEDKPRRNRSSRRARIVVQEESADEEKAAEEKPLELAPEEKPGAVSEATSSSDELPRLEIPDDDDDAPAKPLGIRMDEGEPPAEKKKSGAAPALARKQKGELDRIELADDGEPVIEMLRPQGTPEPAPVAPKRDDGDDPEAAAARAIERYKKDGDQEELAQAKKLFKVAFEKAPAGVPRAAARAGIALAALLGGSDADAKKHAEKALEEDRCCALAISVAAKAARGDGAREKLKAAVARARSALKAGNHSTVAKEVATLEQDFPQEPFAGLVSILSAAEQSRGFDEDVARAWKLYPSTLCPELSFGPGLDAALANAVASWGHLEVEKGGADALIKTQRNLDAKDNVLAGAFQIALGVARTALATRGDVTKIEEQELRAAAAEGLLGLQYYDAAAAAFDKANAIDRQSHAAIQCKKGAERANVARRAFDKPGVKAKMGSFEGVAVAALKKVVGGRVAQATADRQKDEAALLKDEVEAVKVLAADATRRANVVKRARADGSDNPLQPLMDVEGQLDTLSSSKKDLDEQKSAAAEAPKKGFLGRAFDKVKDTAKGAELAVRKQILDGKRDEAYRAVARLLRDAPSSGWGDKVLDALADKGRTVNAKLDYLEDEIKQANKVVAKLNEV